MKQFAVFDIDGTVFRSSLYIEVVYELARQELIDLPETKYETWARRTKSGYQTYRNHLVELLESQLPNISVSDFEEVSKKVVERQAEHVYVYTRDLIREFQELNYFMIAISGSQEQLVEKFANYWNFDAFVGQSYHQADGKFSGKITKTHEGKGKLLQNIIDEHSLPIEGSVAVGDTEGDIETLKMVERPIAFNPNRELYKAAVKSGWEIIVERKDMIYKLQPGSHRNYELIDTE
ncbi:HAD family phosphatase [Candidatus Saccharibacteria bacterium]|jgi:HAD superfamily hydrolase (TIGR01490 family)|nr:HAD family phosphatase [Candidatus Saccharibacteria bacterium]